MRRHSLSLIVALAGAAGGFLYWKYVGCLSGTCPIKSKWYLSTLYGLVLGYLVGSLAEDLIAKFRRGKDAGPTEDTGGTQ